MSDEGERKHTHKWSLQKDPEFMEESALFLSYIIGAQENIPCVHQDHPAVQAVETMIRSSLRGHQMFPGLASAVETFAHVFFAAGQQYARDGHTSSVYPSFEPESNLSGDDMDPDEWMETHREIVEEWRVHVRKQFYGVRKRGLAEVLNHLVETHGDQLALIPVGENGVDEEGVSELLRNLLGHQRKAPEQEQDNRAGPYL